MHKAWQLHHRVWIWFMPTSSAEACAPVGACTFSLMPIQLLQTIVNAYHMLRVKARSGCGNKSSACSRTSSRLQTLATLLFCCRSGSNTVGHRRLPPAPEHTEMHAIQAVLSVALRSPAAPGAPLCKGVSTCTYGVLLLVPCSHSHPRDLGSDSAAKRYLALSGQQITGGVAATCGAVRRFTAC